MKELQQIIEKHSTTLGYLRWGARPLKKPMTFFAYKKWIESQCQGDMTYLEKHLPYKETPEVFFKPMTSVISFSFPYTSIPKTVNQKKSNPFRQLRVSLYAQNYDYHPFILQQLQMLCNTLKERYPEDIFSPAVDSSALMERDYAHQAGLGWFGKNTCLIDRKSGSLFFLAEILTTLNLNIENEISKDFCGTCNKCIEICPTQALTAPHHLDARKCISYLTIESKSNPNSELRKLMGDWFFGCDLCQTICPWNQKILTTIYPSDAKNRNLPVKLLSATERDELVEDLRFILTASNKTLQKVLSTSPLLRARATGLKRNALVVIAHQNINVLTPEIQSYIHHEKLGELAQWVLNELYIL